MLQRWLAGGTETREYALLGRFVTRIGLDMPGKDDLGARLTALASAVADLPGYLGALLVVLDRQGLPFEYRSHGLSLRDEARPFALLADVRRKQLDDGRHDWAQMPPEFFEACDGSRVIGRLLRDSHRRLPAGMLFVAVPDRGGGPPPAWPGTDRMVGYLEGAVSDGLRLATGYLHAGLHRLAADEASPDVVSIDLQHISEGLLHLLSAVSVTVFVEQLGGVLSVTAGETPDDSLDSVLLERVAGTGRPARLRDTGDPLELSDVLSVERPAAEPPGATAQYGLLAVPMNTGRRREDDPRTVGVVRILRGADAAPFTAEEEMALQQFADLLGVALDAAAALVIHEKIVHAESEAVCISRHEGDSIDPCLVYANPGALKLFDQPEEEIIGQPARTLYASDAEYQEVRKLLNEARADERYEVGPISSRVRRRGDEPRHVDISFRLVQTNVEPSMRYTVAVFRDTSKPHRLTEQHKRLMALLDKQGLAYFHAAPDGTTIEPTVTDCRLTGYSAAELKTMPRADLYVDRSKRRELIDRVESAGGDLVRSLQHLRRKDGVPFFAEGVIHELRDDSGRRVGYEGLYQDVTERIRLQGFLDAGSSRVLPELELLEKLQAIQTFHLDYTKSLGHQLRAPLGAILHTLLNLKEQLPRDDRWSRRLEYAIGQARTWGRLIDNFGYMDKLLRGDDFPLEAVNLAKIAIEIRVDFKDVLPEKSLRLRVDGRSLDHLVRSSEIRGHGGLLRQALVNLVENAVKYSYPKTEIRIRGFDAGPQGRVFEISNKGIPIPALERDKIFLRGYRTAKARDITPDGFGMGLWLVRKIVEAHKATIRCAEAEDGRTAFRISFPLEPLKRSVKFGD